MVITLVYSYNIDLPEGYDYILFLSFDFDAESAEYRISADPVALSKGRFGVYRGVYKVLDVLDTYGIKSTFFTPAWVIERYPDVIRDIMKKGHEIASHGYLHERLDELSSSDEESVFNKINEVFLRIIGHSPKGFRSPYWKWSDKTIELLIKHGYIYDSSLMDDEIPYIIDYKGYKLVELPVDWRLDDWPYLEYYRSLTPEDLLRAWIKELDVARNVRGYVSITMHPQCIGRGARITVLEGLLDHAFKTNAWIPRGNELSDWIIKKKFVTRVYPIY